LVLAAGLGTRLLPLTEVRAKPALPIAGQAIIRHIIRSLVGGGVPHVTLNLHHLPQTLTRVIGDGTDLGAAVRYSWEQPMILGSAGGPRQALDIIGADTFFIVNGDTMTDVDLAALADAHHQSGALVTLALVANTQPLRYGGVRLASDGTVIGFSPRGPAAEGSFHFIGVQAVERRAYDGLVRGRAANSIGGLYDSLINDCPGTVQGFVADARFWDIGTVEDYWTTCQAWDPAAAFRHGDAVGISQSAEVTQSILWDDIHIGDGVRLQQCIVTDGVSVPAGATYCRSILRVSRGGAIAATPFRAE
jgi:NDP-sugar pyrophosphorylase family protein